MQWVEILFIPNTNMAGFVWNWTYELGKTAHGQLALRATQQVEPDGDDDEAAPLRQFNVDRSGEVWDDLKNLIEDTDGETGVERAIREATEIIERIRTLDAELADEIDWKLKRERNEEIVYEKTIGRIEHWISQYARQASYEVNRVRWSGFSPMSRLGGTAVEFYTKLYYEEHGQLPAGKHNVSVTFGPKGSVCDVEYGPDWQVNPTKWIKDVTFPEADTRWLVKQKPTPGGGRVIPFKKWFRWDRPQTATEERGCPT